MCVFALPSYVDSNKRIILFLNNYCLFLKKSSNSYYATVYNIYDYTQ